MSKAKRNRLEQTTVVLMRACIGIATHMPAGSARVTLAEVFADFLGFALSSCRVTASQHSRGDRKAWDKAFTVALKKYGRETASRK